MRNEAASYWRGETNGSDAFQGVFQPFDLVIPKGLRSRQSEAASIIHFFLRIYSLFKLYAFQIGLAENWASGLIPKVSLLPFFFFSSIPFPFFFGISPQMVPQL